MYHYSPTFCWFLSLSDLLYFTSLLFYLFIFSTKESHDDSIFALALFAINFSIVLLLFLENFNPFLVFRFVSNLSLVSSYDEYIDFLNLYYFINRMIRYISLTIDLFLLFVNIRQDYFYWNSFILFIFIFIIISIRFEIFSSFNNSIYYYRWYLNFFYLVITTQIIITIH